MVVLYRRPDLSQSEFQAFLRDVHGPLAEAIPDLLHYTQNFVAQDPTREHPAGTPSSSSSGPTGRPWRPPGSPLKVRRRRRTSPNSPISRGARGRSWTSTGGGRDRPMLERNGFSVAQATLSKNEIVLLRDELARLAPSEDRKGGIRSLGLKSDAIRVLAVEGLPAALAREVLGSEARPVKITAFDKTPQANWKVPWHQDLTIAVREKREVEGFGPWSLKDGIPHVQPPVEILSRMVADPGPPRRHAGGQRRVACGPREPPSRPDRPCRTSLDGETSWARPSVPSPRAER